MPRNSGQGLAKQHRMTSLADTMAKESHFNSAECKVFLYIYEKLRRHGVLDRPRMREILHILFGVTDDVMLDLVFRAFNRDSTGQVSEVQWIKGLSIMLRGEIEELIEFCYFVYDMNGDGSLAREELQHCLRGCIFANYGIDHDDLDECERDMVELCMKKLDVDHDGQITFEDFKKAVYKDPLMIQAIGVCLPSANSSAAFLALITDNYRNHAQCLARDWGKKEMRRKKSMTSSKMKHSNPKDFINFNIANTGIGTSPSTSEMSYTKRRKSMAIRKSLALSQNLTARKSLARRKSMAANVHAKS